MIGISFLEADLLHLAEELDQLLLAGVNSIFIDFLSCRKTAGAIVGPKVCRSLREHGVRCPVNVLLKSGVSESMIRSLYEAGANQIIVDSSVIGRIDTKSLSTGCLGMAATPDVLLDQRSDILPYLDTILIQLDVNNSEGPTLKYISQVKALVSSLERKIKLTISGKFEHYDLAILANSGIDGFVFGKSIFSSGDYYTAVSTLKRQISGGRTS